MTQIGFDKLHAGTPRCPSELALDKWFAEALSPTERETIGIHVESCETCSDRVELRRAGMDAFPTLDEDRLLAAIQKQLADTRSPSPSGPIWTGDTAQRNPVQ